MPRTAKPPIDPLNVSETGQGLRKPLRPDKPAADARCGAKRPGGKPDCKLPAGYGTDHAGWGSCKWHWGATPGGAKSAARQQAAELVKFYGGPIDTNPIDALLDEVRRTSGHVQFLGEKVSSWLATETTGDDGAINSALKGWIDLYQSERAHLAKVSRSAIDAGVNERLVQIAEHQGMRLADAVESILNALNLSPEQRALVPSVVPSVLRGLTATHRVIEGEVVD